MARKKSPRREAGSITWVNLARSVQDVERTAREVSQLLCGLPQPDPEAPPALRGAAAPSDTDDWHLSQCPYPISYREAAQHLTVFGWDQDPQRWARDRLLELGVEAAALNRYLKPRRTRGEAVGSGVPRQNAASKSRRPAVINHRPGQGGRQPRLDRGDAETALGELQSMLGKPVLWRVSNEFVEAALVAVWDARNDEVSDLLDPHGNTLIHGRMSSSERKNDETPPAHIQPCLDLCGRHEELRPRMVVMAVDLPGTPDPEFRPDFELAEHAIQTRWVRHVVWRSGDRIARELVPAELYYRMLRKAGVGLWLAKWTRKVNWQADRLALRAENMVSAEERAMIDGRLQYGALTQGPLAGRGWLGSPPRFGLMRQRKELVVDEEQWGWIKHIFFKARQLKDGSPNSTRDLADQLGKRCPFDHEQIRTMLRDPIYVTGEWAVWVRGVLVAQDPIEWPGGGIPASVFQDVQNILGLNQGRTSRTPLGEFLLNYVECVHLRCKDAPRNNGNRALIKGYMEASKKPGEPHKVGRYGHYPFCPDQCRNQGFRYDKTELEHPVVRESWRLVEHPALRKAVDGQTIYPVSPMNGSLSPAARRELEGQIARVQARKDAAEREWMDVITNADDPELDIKALWQEIVQRVHEELQELQGRLADDDLMRAEEDPTSEQGLKRERRREALREILTLDTPEDPRHRALRAAVFQKLFPRVEIGEDEHGRLKFRLFSNLVPAGIPSLAASDPLEVAGAELDRHWANTRGTTYDEKAAVSRFELQAEREPENPVVQEDASPAWEAEEEEEFEPWLDEQARAKEREARRLRAEAGSHTGEDQAGRDASGIEGARLEGGDTNSQTALGARDYKAVRGNVYELLARPSANSVNRAERAARRDDGRPLRRSRVPTDMAHGWCSDWIVVEDSRLKQLRDRLGEVSARYARALELRLQGYTAQEVAAELGLALATIRGYLAGGCSELGVSLRDVPMPSRAAGPRSTSTLPAEIATADREVQVAPTPVTEEDPVGLDKRVGPTALSDPRHARSAAELPNNAPPVTRRKRKRRRGRALDALDHLPQSSPNSEGRVARVAPAHPAARLPHQCPGSVVGSPRILFFQTPTPPEPEPERKGNASASISPRTLREWRSEYGWQA